MERTDDETSGGVNSRIKKYIFGVFCAMREFVVNGNFMRIQLNFAD